MPIAATPAALARLRRRCRALPEPGNYHLGRTAAGAELPANLLLFSRRLLGAHHQHDNQHHRYMLLVSLRTAGDVCLNERALHLGEGQALLVFPYQLHHYLTLETPLDWLFITFELADATPLLPLRNRPVTVPARTVPLLDGLLRAWAQPAGERRLALLLALALDDLATTAGAAPPLPERSAPLGHAVLLERVNRYVYAHLAERIAIRDLARAMHLSPSRLGTLFRRQLGLSPARYVRRVKLHHAARLLHTSGLDVSEVAARTGFASLFAFSRAFKTVVGVAPSHYRHAASHRQGHPPAE
jgi:AraC-like DNA-binding protein